MFSTMRKRLITAIGMRPISFDYLMDCSMSTSESARSDYSLQSTTSSKLLSKLGIQKQTSLPIDLCECDPKKGAIKVLKVIKQLNYMQSPELNLMAFIEMVQIHFYHNVSLSLLKNFMEYHKVMPQPFYFHYFIYFLYYAEYYHFTRGSVDVIDSSKREFHEQCLEAIRIQIKYVYRIINSQSQEISL